MRRKTKDARSDRLTQDAPGALSGPSPASLSTNGELGRRWAPGGSGSASTSNPKAEGREAGPMSFSRPLQRVGAASRP